MIITIIAVLLVPSLISMLLYNRLKSDNGNYEFKMGMLDGSFSVGNLWMATLAPGINYFILVAMIRDIVLDAVGKSERKKRQREIEQNPHYVVLESFKKTMDLYASEIAGTPRAEMYMKTTKTIRSNLDNKAVQFMLTEYEQVFLNTIIIHEESKKINLSNRNKVLKKRLEIIDQFSKEISDFEEIQKRFEEEFEQKTFERLMEESEDEHRKIQREKLKTIKNLVKKEAV